ncbi:MAG: capsular biosynthesis protein CpsI, partial [Gammaproteobacteria bacterium]|nr:capsular biosynthesis protein CpsI [Gammaproteobacteria bacterium]
ADIEIAKNKIGYNPKTSVSAGLEKFIDWYLNYTNS